MSWIYYTSDEVECFHPVFKEAADAALRKMGLESQFVWEHHLKTPGNSTVPDFVLIRKDNARWIMAVEIKRNKASLYSTRNQIQAKGYVETNSDLFYEHMPKYFAISNLEEIVLFALKNGAPPNECLLKNGKYDIGLFSELSENEFKESLTKSLCQLVERVISEKTVEFDEVWQRILKEFIKAANELTIPSTLNEPVGNGWDLVRDYFCHPVGIDSSRVFLLRLMLAEFIRGVLERFKHPEAARLLGLRKVPLQDLEGSLTEVFSQLRSIDFEPIFEDYLLGKDLKIVSKEVARTVAEYVEKIITPPFEVYDLARKRLDRNQFLDGLLFASHPGEEIDNRGKVATDPELASMLSALTIRGKPSYILDPCCGDGALLEGAYDKLMRDGLTHSDIISRLSGVEADPLLAKLSALRLILKDPASIKKGKFPHIKYGDMFASNLELNKAEVILMNPPFKRYESQDISKVPEPLKQYYSKTIEKLSGCKSITEKGQPNLYIYYLEFLLNAVGEGCRLGIILDNKWYHNKYAIPLKNALIDKTCIEAIVEYPYTNLFSNWSIATSILICQKTKSVPKSHRVKFIRCLKDITRVDFSEVSLKFDEIGMLDGWSVKEVEQIKLNPKEGWKNYFQDELNYDYRKQMIPLPSLFQFKRRGSLAKEEGGMSTLAFPFSRRTFGYVRTLDGKAKRRNQTKRKRPLSKEENKELIALAARVKTNFKGFAIENADTLNSYVLSGEQLNKQPTVDPPALKGKDFYWSNRKTAWTSTHQLAIREIMADPAFSKFVNEFRKISGLNSTIMSDESLWVGLKEPYAGELIVPRKMRAGFRVHINPQACLKKEKNQVRVSSNFISFVNCMAVDNEKGIDRLTATKIIVAFLLSSFGQLQFEMNGYNREGCLSVELHHLQKIHVIDPRNLSKDDRNRILVLLDNLEYPIPMNHSLTESSKRYELDLIFARIICSLNEGWKEEDLICETHQLLSEYLQSRVA